jgi:hypothetical protein
MEDLKISIHRGSCQKNQFTDQDFIKLLKINLEKYKPTFSSHNDPVDGYFIFGYSQMLNLNATDLEQNEIYKILEDTFKTLVQQHNKEG